MAIYVNGIKVAGRGISGKSPYQVAVEGGYTGLEAEFNAQLAAIGAAVSGFNELSQQVENARTDIESAVTQATETIANVKNELDQAVENALAQIPNAENLATKTYVIEQINSGLSGHATESWVNTQISDMATKTYLSSQISDMATKTYLSSQISDMATQTWVNAQIDDMATKTYLSSQISDMATKTYLSSQLNDMATQTWVTGKINEATASIVTTIWHYGSSAPSNTKLLWIDSNSTTGGLKYYKSATDGWVHVPVAWQ